MICNWCQSNHAHEMKDDVHWELPDGTRAVTIKNVPSVHCPSCNMTYLEEAIIQQIEDQLFIIDTAKLDKQFSYEQLLNAPKLFKRNYFQL